jgi:hypothetical protein
MMQLPDPRLYSEQTGAEAPQSTAEALRLEASAQRLSLRAARMAGFSRP